MPEALLVDLHEGVQTITFNRPDRLNAFTATMLKEIADVLKTAERDDAIKALVFTGAGRAFTSGQDVSEFVVEGSQEMPRLGAVLRQRVNPLIQRMRALEKPVLAAVNGVTAGAGMGFALACDLRYAAESARFIQAFVNIGLVPDAGSQYFLPRLVGTAKALELAWTGAPVSANEALQLGIVERVFPDGEVLGATQELGSRLAKGPTKAIALMKRGISRSHDLDIDRVLEIEADYQEVASRTSDFAEGVHAFIEKRPATFKGA